MKIPELLAPAGSFETLIAVCNAGADAVYAAGSKYGARAYADNFTEDELCEAISYVHLHGKKLYLTVNTLLKDDELSELYDYLLPLYVKGLDGVIVQDFGVIDYIKEQFPNLPIHISTQAAAMGEDSANLFKEIGADRVVLARELSLDEIKHIKETSDIELEIFIHGALCYSYSGMCFYSSLIGGRSGNRGRCAQPCRMNYTIAGKSKDWLSLKDLSVLNELPRLCEIGVDSLKIEGRMKNKDYAAGATLIYRKYLDMLKNCPQNYEVDRNDIDFLNKLYQRRGFSNGYLHKHNGPDMLIDEGDKKYEQNNSEYKFNYMNRQKVRVSFSGYFNVDTEAVLVLTDEKNRSVTVLGDICQPAKSKPLTDEIIKDKLGRVNDTPLELIDIYIELNQDIFMAVSSLNELRRNAIEEYLNLVDSEHKREVPDRICFDFPSKKTNISEKTIAASFLEFEQGYALAKNSNLRRVYFPYELFVKDNLESIEVINLLKLHNKQVFLSMPEIFRLATRKLFITKIEQVRDNFDGLLIKNSDELYFAHKFLEDMDCVLDFTLYSFNSFAIRFLKKYYNKLTASIELNEQELKNLDLEEGELVVYGRYPMMYTANCLVKNSKKCTNSLNSIRFKDRMHMSFYVKTFCNSCYNIIFNTKKTSLLGVLNKANAINVSSYRYSFTDEKADEVLEILQSSNDPKDFTRGHFIRGVQ